ncbi:Exodeoxyribonuclease 7 small subunit [Candidatus Fokinia solitaria]|uniref:Exodeoxyribonuclease VII small subunit n=1 Tax=Candidatus Fokinia solitaria TaxID=1802984 RepID=A0A2U8BSU8_9RICK|nr:exodeoxyribonuclease VII small subunit [Candidatus Fokinia solitaria]AWD33350.1 Exodeoxyribonuclease 7 small subunit [Candidatus Fokinia solitaria]
MNEKDTLLKFQNNLQELSDLTKELDKEGTPLSRIIELYEKGTKLCNECYILFESAKKIVETLQNAQQVDITSETKAFSFEKAYKKIEEISQESTDKLGEAFEKARMVRELKAHCDNLLSAMKVKILEIKSDDGSTTVKKSDLQDKYLQNYSNDTDNEYPL